MVTTAPTLTAFDNDERSCPRCAASMIIAYDERKCIVCGFADYGYAPPTPIAKDNLMSRATEFRFRYAGESATLTETVIHASLKRVRNRVIYDVTCPFCAAGMEQSSLSGKRREVREERYRCPQEHRVSLIPKRGGGMSWK